MTIETVLEHLTFRQMEIRFFSERRVQMRQWIGSVLRNNFMYAAEGCARRIITSTIR